jgi:hypothetical protein
VWIWPKSGPSSLKLGFAKFVEELEMRFTFADGAIDAMIEIVMLDVSSADLKILENHTPGSPPTAVLVAVKLNTNGKYQRIIAR